MATAQEEQIKKQFDDMVKFANDLYRTSATAINEAYKSFSDPEVFKYEPYQWELPHPPIIIPPDSPPGPNPPGDPGMPTKPSLLGFPGISNPDYGGAPDFTGQPLNPEKPVKPGPEPADTTGQVPKLQPPHWPQVPGNAGSLLTLPSQTLPYPTINIPQPHIDPMPVFDGRPPDDIHQISFDEYMQKLTDAYAKYSKDIPALVYSNWMLWFKSYLGERPLIDKLAGIISHYLDTGGAGIPTPIEEAIVTRNTDRVVAEQRRATLNVYDAAVKRGLLLPSGALVAGLKEARQVTAEAVSKVATDIAIKNLELEHDHMKFMIQMGIELEKWVAGFAGDIAKIVLEANAQAIEMTKFVLTGMIEINNIMVKIYLAQWEGFKGAVEVYKAKISAIEAEVRIYEALIKAEMAKVEIDKAWVEMINAVANANRSIAEVYKTQVEAEGLKVEAFRAEVMAYEASVRAYAARVEAWRARWLGYSAEWEGEVSKSKVYEAQVNAYSARVNAYRARVDAYSARVRAEADQIQAIGTENEEQLKGWQIEVDGKMKQYVARTEGYRAEWQAVAGQWHAAAENTRIIAEGLFKGYEMEMRVDSERAREHLSEWTAALSAHLHAAEGLTGVAKVNTDLAAAALNSLTAFSGSMVTLQGSSG